MIVGGGGNKEREGRERIVIRVQDDPNICSIGKLPDSIYMYMYSYYTRKR